MFQPAFQLTWRSLTRSVSRSGLRRGRQLYSTSAEVIIKPIKVINQPVGTQFQISERAATRLADIYNDCNEVLKISVESGGCHGFQYNMKLVPEKKIEEITQEQPSQTTIANEHKHTDEEVDDFDDDFETNKDVIFVLPNNQGKIVIDQNSLKILNKTTLTYSTELIGSTFKISGGNMKSSCGCGSSFDVELEK